MIGQMWQRDTNGDFGSHKLHAMGQEQYRFDFLNLSLIFKGGEPF